jgi:16S rRNA processing protein RimM
MMSPSLEQSLTPESTSSKEKPSKPESPLQLRLRGDGWLEVGQLKGVQGLEGHIKVTTSDAVADWVNTETEVCLVPEHRALMKRYPEGWRGTFMFAETAAPFRARVKLEGHETPEEAKAWVNALVYVNVASLPEINEDDTFRTHQLMGLAVHIATHEEALGEVTAILSDKANPAGDVFVEIRMNVSRKELLIPFQAHFVAEVDLPHNRLVLQGLDEFLISQNQPVPYKQKAMTPYMRRKLKQQAQRDATLKEQSEGESTPPTAVDSTTEG